MEEQEDTDSCHYAATLTTKKHSGCQTMTGLGSDVIHHSEIACQHSLSRLVLNSNHLGKIPEDAQRYGTVPPVRVNIFREVVNWKTRWQMYTI